MTKVWDNDLSGAREELETMSKDVAVYDPMLAGWYLIWSGIIYFAEGKTDAATDLFDEARSRIGRALPLPHRNVTEAVPEGPAVTAIEEALRAVVNDRVGRINDKIAKMKASASDAFSSLVSHKKAEEAIRVIGASLGFQSSRPCTNFGAGPDNLWIDLRTKQMIAFELKSDKSVDLILKKEDIGQGLNHIEWLRNSYPELKLLGLIF